MTGSSGRTSRAGLGLTVAALGVVFGDIGTSPLYALPTIFERSALRPVAIDQDSVYGVVSVIFWSITAVVTVLYVALLLRADNHGEGGLLSLLALLRRQRLSRRRLAVLSLFGVFGAGLFFGDSMITPAISVLSSVEGLEIVDPRLQSLVVPIAAVILLGLLLVQRFGTSRVGGFFGPVMAVWFGASAACGTAEIARDPAILRALSPLWALRYFAASPLTAFLSLGGVVLVITGAEALYADLGHVGRAAISRSWLMLVFPALVLEYFGQGALLLRDPSAAHNPFFLMVPQWARFPMVVLAMLSTVIASQAVISGAFSVSQQAARLGYLPMLRIVHTSRTERGQVYIPFVNWVLLVAVLGLVVGFGSSSRLAAAYGLADIGTIATSTTLFFALQWVLRNWPRWRIWALGCPLLGIVLAFLGANTVKIAEGGWLPVSIGVLLFVVLTTWQRGSELSETSRAAAEGSLADFVDRVHASDPPVERVPGCAVFLSRSEDRTPLALWANLEHNHTVHESTILLTFENTTAPRVPRRSRLVVSDLGFGDDGISHLTVRLGYRDHPAVPDVLRQALDEGLESTADSLDSASYFLSVPHLVVTRAPGMARWRKHLFVITSRLTSDPVELFDLPRRRTVVMGAEIDI